MHNFQLSTSFTASGDQPEAIEAVTTQFLHGAKEQVLLGVTGSGKTFTMAHVIQNLQRPTLIISHNKTLAAQLYQEFRDFFPNNAVSYFVSYYDYYQPEAYVPQTDTYIEKETDINADIDKLRLAATTNLLTRKDTIIIASVSCIYNIGSPKEYGNFVLELRAGMPVSRDAVFERLVQLQYERADYGFSRGTFRVRGDSIDIFPAYEDISYRIVTSEQKIVSIDALDPVSGKKSGSIEATVIYPAKHYMTDPKTYTAVFDTIRSDLEKQLKLLKSQNKVVEAYRLNQKVQFDLEMIAEMGYVNGIENYSRYFDGRKPGDPPYTLFDYFDHASHFDRATYSVATQTPWLLIIDESHMSLPQIRGMYNGDRARKQTLIDYGFRLPSALDNRPLQFAEFLRRIPQTLYVSATPNVWEIEKARESEKFLKSKSENTHKVESDQEKKNIDTMQPHEQSFPSTVVEQLVRPTGLLDPEVEVRPSEGQIDDVLLEVQNRIAKKERVLITTLTKRMAEDLSTFIEDKGIRVHYLHSDINTLERSDILADLRGGTYDVVVGINLLREGLDLPEVSLVIILDADKEGFLRSRTSLVQTMGRAARHQEGKVILYADRITDSMKFAMEEVSRRRKVQIAYNKKHGITPKTIQKPIRERLIEKEQEEEEQTTRQLLHMSTEQINGMTPKDMSEFKKELEKRMREAAKELNFELAAQIRDALKKM